MTENEAKAIKWMKSVRDDAVVTLDSIAKNEPNVSPMLYAGRREKAETIIKGFEELEQYRAIGTVEEIKKVVQFLSLDNDRGIIEDLQSLNKYWSIGTVEECREARERQIGKKPNKREDKYTDLIQHYSCPVCGKYFGQAGTHSVILFDKPKYCDCGQAIDWSDA